MTQTDEPSESAAVGAGAGTDPRRTHPSTDEAAAVFPDAVSVAESTESSTLAAPADEVAAPGPAEHATAGSPVIDLTVSAEADDQPTAAEQPAAAEPVPDDATEAAEPATAEIAASADSVESTDTDATADVIDAAEIAEALDATGTEAAAESTGVDDTASTTAAAESTEPGDAGPASSEAESAETAAANVPADVGAPAGGFVPGAPRPLAVGQVLPATVADGFASGQLVSGRVVSVDANEVVVDLGERLGVISKRHLTVDGKTDPTELVNVGDEIESAVLVREDPKNRVVLSRTWAAKQRAWQTVDEALASGKPVSGPVLEAVKGGLVVDIGIRAFLPASQVDLVHVDDLSSFVGQPIEALVTEADRATDKVVLSRRNLLRQHDRHRVNELMAGLAAGQVRRGRVATITDFGAFVDLGGVRGLLHLSELSWERVDRTSDVLKVGDEVEVKILSVKGGAKRISLSMRALTPDPLEGLMEGQTLEGVVTRLVDFGAFVRIANKIEGLVHVSELAEYRVHLPEEVVTPGDEVWVKVIRIDRKRRRVDLSVNQAVQF